MRTTSQLMAALLTLSFTACQSATDEDGPVCADMQIQSTKLNPYQDEKPHVGATAVTSTGVAVPGVTVQFSTSNPAVATVDQNGEVTPRNPGSAIITASAPCGPGGAMVSASITIVVRPSTERWNGTWDGSFTGSVAGPAFNGPINGAVAFTANNGNIVLTQPTSGTGTIGANGSASFAGSLNGGLCTWTGTFRSDLFSSDGTWSCTGQVSGSGTWFAKEKTRAPYSF